MHSQMAGTHFGKGAKFALVEVRGDWKWHRELWALTHHYTKVNICHLCRASTHPGPNQWLGLTLVCGTFRYSNFTGMAGVARLGTAGFYLEALGNYVNPLAATIGFSPEMIRFCRSPSAHASKKKDFKRASKDGGLLWLTWPLRYACDQFGNHSMDQCFHNLDFDQLRRFGIWESGG